MLKQCGVFIIHIRKNEEKVWVNCGVRFADKFFSLFLNKLLPLSFFSPYTLRLHNSVYFSKQTLLHRDVWRTSLPGPCSQEHSGIVLLGVMEVHQVKATSYLPFPFLIFQPLLCSRNSSNIELNFIVVQRNS